MDRHKTSMFSEYENNENPSASSKQLELWLMQMAPKWQHSPEDLQHLTSTSSRYEPDGITFAARQDTFSSANKENFSGVGNSSLLAAIGPQKLNHHRAEQLSKKEGPNIAPHSQSLGTDRKVPSGESQNPLKRTNAKSSYIFAMEDLQKRAKTLEEENLQMKRSLSLYQDEQRSSLQSSMVLSNEFREKQLEVERLSSMAEQIKRENKRLKDTKHEQSFKVKQMEKSISEQSEKCKSLEERLNKLSIENSSLSKDLLESTSLAKSLMSENKTLSEKLDILENMKESSTNSILEKYSKSLERIEQLENEVSTYRNKMKTEKEEKRKLTEDSLSSVQKIKSKLHEEILEKQRLKVKLESLEENKRQDQSKMRQIRQENDSLKSKISKRDTDIEQLQQKHLKLLEAFSKMQYQQQPTTKNQSPESMIESKLEVHSQKGNSTSRFKQSRKEATSNRQSDKDHQSGFSSHQDFVKSERQQTLEPFCIAKIDRTQPLIRSSENSTVEKGDVQNDIEDSFDEKTDTLQNTGITIAERENKNSNLPRKNFHLHSKKGKKSSSLNESANRSKKSSFSRGSNQKPTTTLQSKPHEEASVKVNSRRKSAEQGPKNIRKKSQEKMTVRVPSKQSQSKKQKKHNSFSRQGLQECSPINDQSDYMIEEEHYRNRMVVEPYSEHPLEDSNNQRNISKQAADTIPGQADSSKAVEQSLPLEQSTLGYRSVENRAEFDTCAASKSFTVGRTAVHRYPEHYLYSDEINNTGVKSVGFCPTSSGAQVCAQKSLSKAMLLEYQQEALELYEEQEKMLEQFDREDLTNEEKSELMGRYRQVMETINRNTEKMLQLKSESANP